MEQEIRRYLGKTTVVGSELRCFDVIDSTNTYLKKVALEGAADGTVVISEHQTAGRGRMTRSFESPEGKGIYLSVLLRPQLPPEKLLPVTALAGVAVCDAVERVCGVRPGLKWPNDPVLGKRKVCGILTEMVLDEKGRPNVILGIGINVSQTAEDFSPEVSNLAASLFMALGRRVSRPALIAALLEELDRLYAALLADDLMAYLTAYRRDCVNLGKTVQLIGADGSWERAEAVDVDEAFGLVVRGENGELRTVRAGEVSVRGLYGYLE